MTYNWATNGKNRQLTNEKNLSNMPPLQPVLALALGLPLDVGLPVACHPHWLLKYKNDN
jgi:hypothetical protein